MNEPWSPRTERREDRVTAGAARALHDLLEGTGEAPEDGAELPLLWHWLAFLPRARQSALGPDGHPATGSLLPPSSGRRMFAGGRADGTGLLRVGEPLTRETTVGDVRDTRGRSGPLRFVTVDARLGGSGGTVEESSTLVYRGPADAVADAAVGAVPEPAADPVAAEPPGDTATGPGPDDAGWSSARTVPVDPVLLFRFSALTYNAHRIHYDRDHAVRVEGYPGLVVHGPLQALLLADLVTRERPGRRLATFRFRALAPAFDQHDLELRSRETAAGVELAAYSAGTRTMTATATVVPLSAEAP